MHGANDNGRGKLADDMATYVRTGDLRGLSLVQTRNDLRARRPTLSGDEVKTLAVLDALLSSEPPERL